MRDTHDQRMRELAYRLIEMAPEAPPFPEEPMVKFRNHPATATSNRRRILVFVASIAVVLVIGIAAQVLLLSDDSPSPPVTQAVDFPNLTTTFVSPMNGYSVDYPDTGEGTLTPATELWEPSNDEGDHGRDVVDTGLGAVFKGASMEVEDGVSIDEWVDDVFEDLQGPVGRGPTPRFACGVPRSQQEEITIDGQSGRLAECANEIEATVVAGGRLYLFTLLHTRSDARAVFDAFAATIDLTPDTAVDFSAFEFFFDPLTLTTHVSPTNGFSYEGHPMRGTIQPAEVLWDPVSGAPHNELPWEYFRPENGFDWVETGLAGAFWGASTEIPDGVSIDEWVDDVIVDLPGCYVRVIPQEEITIDGQSGRVSECLGSFDATVVAGGRLYFFRMMTDRVWFDALIATIDLRPEDAALPQSTP